MWGRYPDRRTRDRSRPYDRAVTQGALRRLGVALAGLVAVTVLGTVGYLLLGFTFLEALYQTVTTVATVGFREIRPLSPVGMVFTIVLIVVGVGVVLYNLGLIVEVLTEGHLRQHLERRRMDRKIESLRAHVIVCGYGRVGRAACEQLVAGGEDVVVVDVDPGLAEEVDGPYLVGDVTNDEVLRRAGMARARALVVCLESDADTVYTVLSARAMRPDLVIVARARTTGSAEKMLMAGATHAVNPQRIGGRRLAVFALQPDVAEFLDVVMHEENLDFRIQQVPVEPGSALDGHALADLDLRGNVGALVLALRVAARRPLEPNPAPSTVVPAGAVLIALGTPEELDALEALGTARG